MHLIRRAVPAAAFATLVGLGLAAPAARAQAPTIISNFTGLMETTDPALAGGGVLTPPDTMGAMGLNNQFAEFINGGFALYNANLGTPQAAPISDSAFWTNAGVPAATIKPGLSDTRILFDSASQRWFASEITTPAQNNQVLIAVSNTADASQGFKGYSFDFNPAPPATSNNYGADFDQLGITATGVFIGNDNFTKLAAGGTYASTSLIAISKADLLAGVAAPASRLIYDQDANMTGFLPHPVTDLDLATSAFYTPNVEYALSPSNQVFGASVVSTLSGDATNPGTLTFTAPSDNVTVPADNQPPPAPQGTGLPTIDTGDDRNGGAVIKKLGYLWATQNTLANGRSAVLWLQIDPVTKALVNSGLISDAAHDYYYGSIAVNSNGDIVIGYSGSSDAIGSVLSPSAFASVGKLSGGVVTMGGPMLLKSGLPYTSFDSVAGPVRWGDYSNTVVDPTDPTKFWTIQEFSGGPNNWSTQITGIQIPAPEPSQLAALGLGALGLAGLAFKARRRAVNG